MHCFTNRSLMPAAIKPFIMAVFFILSSTVYSSQDWQRIDNGLFYQDLNPSMLKPWTHIHVFKVNPKLYQFESVSAKSLDRKAASAETFGQANHALITINGGFFDHDYRSLGLRISNYQKQNPLKRISWWGVFYIYRQQAFIKSVNQFRPHQGIHFAIQSGPRLIINGKIPSLKPGIAERTALCVDNQDNIIVLVTDNFSMSTHDLAELMAKAPLNCVNALNLDGGKSTQLYAQVKDFNLSVSGYTAVGDAVIIKKK